MNRISRIAVDLPDSSTLESIRQAEEVSRRIAMGLQNSQVLESIRQAEEVSRRIAVGLQDSQVLESIRQAEEVSRRIAVGLQDSQVLESIRQAEEVSRRIAVGLQDSQVLKSIQAVVDSARLTSIALQESPAMKAIREFSNTPFYPVVKETVFKDLDALEIERSNIPEYPDFDTDQNIQSEIQRELAGNRDYNGLSNRAKSFLLFIFLYCILPYFFSILSNLTTPYIQPYIQKILQTNLQDKETLSEIKSYVRRPSLEINKELLKGYRVVTRSDVHLRKRPSMKSEIITRLPLGKLIEVIDKSNRSWLYVKVDIEGDTFVGWMSRRYTTYFK